MPRADRAFPGIRAIFPIAVLEDRLRLPDGTLVELIDLRFGTPNPGFEAEALVDASNHVLESQAGFGRIPVRGP